MIRDRGNIKWTAMMLPEHVELLREWASEDQYKAKPEIDEQQQAVINDILMEAIRKNKEVVVTHYDKRKYCLLLGVVNHYDQLEQRINVVDKFENQCEIELTDILDVRWA